MSDLMSANFIMIMGLIGSDEDFCDEKKEVCVQRQARLLNKVFHQAVRRQTVQPFPFSAPIIH